MPIQLLGFNTGMMSTKYSKMKFIHQTKVREFPMSLKHTYAIKCYGSLLKVQSKKFDNYKETNIIFYIHDYKQTHKQKNQNNKTRL